MNPPKHASAIQTRRAQGLPSASTLSRAVRCALALSAVAGIALTPSAFATNFAVTSTADTSDSGTLRWAIDQANAAAGADTITFAANVSGTITLASGSLYISDALTITGPGAGMLVVDGGNAGNVFSIATDSPAVGTAMPATISGLTISGGAASHGGGINVYKSDLTITASTVSGNSVGRSNDLQGASGGGIAVSDTHLAVSS